MNIKQVIDSDFRIDGVSDEVQRWLRKIPIINKKSEDDGNRVELELLEILMFKYCEKYGLKVSWITHTMVNNDKKQVPWYTTTVIDVREGNKYVKTLYGLTLYELIAKAVLFLYAFTRKR